MNMRHSLRFQNTLLNLSECLNELRFEGTSTIESAEEREAAAQLYALAAKFREVYEQAQGSGSRNTGSSRRPDERRG